MGKLTYQEKRARMNAWLRNADEVLAEYGEGDNGDISSTDARPEPPDAA